MAVLLFLLLFNETTPPEELVLGRLHRDSLEKAKSVHVLTYEPESTVLVTITLDSFDFDVHLSVRSSDGRTFRDDNSGVETNARLVLALVKGVRYEFEVSSRGGNGEYLMRAATGRIELVSNLESSVKYRSTAAERALDRGDRRGAAEHALIMGEQLSSLARYERAIAALDASLELWVELRAPREQVRVLEGLAYCYLGEGKIPEARDALERMVKLAAQEGMRAREANAHELLGQIYRRLDQPDALEASLDRRLALTRAREDASDMVEVLWDWVEFTRASGRRDVRTYLKLLVPLLEKRGDPAELRRAYARFAEAELGSDPEKSERWARKGLELGRDPGTEQKLPTWDEHPHAASLLGSLASARALSGDDVLPLQIREVLLTHYDRAHRSSEEKLAIAEAVFDLGTIRKTSIAERRVDAERLIKASRTASEAIPRIKAMLFVAAQDFQRSVSVSDAEERERLRREARVRAIEALDWAEEERQWLWIKKARAFLEALSE